MKNSKARKTTKVRAKRPAPAVAVLQQLEQGTGSLFDFHLDPVFTMNPTGRFLSVNPAIEKLTGYSKAELREMNFEKLCASDQLRYNKE